MRRKFTSAQEAVLEYFRNDLNNEKREELTKIVHPIPDAGFSSCDFIDELVKMYTTVA